MSADLFAAFEDFSQPPPQQNQAKPPSTQSASTPFSFGSPLNPLVPNPSQKQWGQSSTASNHYRHSWQSSQPSPAPNPRPASVATNSFANIQPMNNVDTEDDDGWGDFEVAASAAPSPAPSQSASVTPTPVITKQPITAQNIGLQRTRIVRASTLDLVSNSLVDFEEPLAQPSQSTKHPIPSVNFQPSSKPPEPKVQRKAINADPNVLFDADDFEGEQDGDRSEGDDDDDDDFGEFETMPSPAQLPLNLISSALSVPSPNTTKSASELLLGLDLNEPAPTYTKHAQTNPVQTHAATRNQDLNRPKPYSESGQPRRNEIHMKSQYFEDDWGSFDDLPKKSVKSSTKPVESTWDWDSVEEPKTIIAKSPIKKPPTPPSNDNTTDNDDASWDWNPADIKTETRAEIEDSTLPPINIPPPSILMSAFPQLFNQANEYLYKPVSGQPPSIKDRILSDPKVYEFLRGYLSLAAVAARIIAGRRMRWHRDKFLLQSMSISAAGSKGMKLAGIDKTQTTREDREAADVVSNWKSQIGRLRSTVASASSATNSGGKQLKIPEITDTMQVQTAKDVPTAPKACVICGLKRNERLARVDHEVEDSFGEWWADHWGHVACKRFWLNHEKMLR
ncbi:hypothetical protein HD806DRAFT_4317 [Xylariaceae sp. AK1471]|nr:hypothetical protein HD806DRAFT_4317 [Xylariaceae sp. AK1471]